MKTIAAISLATLLAVATRCAFTQKAGQVPQSVGVAITNIVITQESFQLTVELSNLTNTRLLIWDIDAVPGREIAAFSFPDSMGGTVRAYRKENTQDHSGKPKMAAIPPKGKLQWDFDLFDGSWHIPEYLGSGATNIVNCEISAPATDAALRNEVWAGTVVSESKRMPVSLAQMWPGRVVPYTSKIFQSK